MDLSIVVPTYNERDNMLPLWSGIVTALGTRWTYELIVVDDGSPDGTGEVVRRMSVDDPRVRLLSRGAKHGLASAVTTGFGEARGRWWVVMDADRSHRPQDLPRLVEALDHADIAVGSRYVVGGSSEHWPLLRRFYSRAASATGRRLAGVALRDVTSGFAAFRREVVEPLLPGLEVEGFKIVLEIVARCPRSRIVEVPITFVDRVAGRSKLGPSDVVGFFRQCWALGRLSRATRG